MVDGEFDNLTVKGPNVLFQRGFISRVSGNILYYADKRFDVSSSGSISSVGNAFKIGDSYAVITDSSLPIVVTIENSSGFPHGTIASSISPYIQAHNALSATFKVELKDTDGNWITVYGPTSTSFAAAEIKLLGSTSSLTYPDDFPVKGIRFTISGFSGTAYIRQFGYYHSRMLESSPFLTIDGGTIYGNAPSLTNQEMVDAIYKWENGEWCPEGLDAGDSALAFNDNLTKNCTQLFLIISEDNYAAPLLATNQGFIVQKDITAGGFLGSNQGVLFLGHGLNADDEPPRINLMHSSSGYDTLNITESNGSTLANMYLKNLTADGLVHGGGSSGDAFKVGDDIYLRDINLANAVSFQGAQNRANARLYLGSGNDVYIERGGTNTLYAYMNIEPGNGSNTGYLGEGGRYWYGLVSRYVYYKTLSSFDEYDDLSIAKLWGETNQNLPEDYDGTKLKPPTNDPFRIIKGSKEEANTEEFFDSGKVNGFLMGCVKALAKKQDEHDSLLLKLLNEVETLSAKIAS